ncbi:general transcription factor 3C polypeptide 2 [Xyrichtys novacula]|uniref:General transcription factor 3C polypeptide 2 n=1 Tax=Xyrichtys novacula TaxID=13765 RepID=A0AAV1GWL5_XYRNO|nr:general transcription factor 3C polypeptide 2 [Xyrichtys novacula]
MDPSDSGQGQETPSEQNSELTLSSRGRQRKPNSRYKDFETEDTCDVEKKSPRRSSEGGRRAAAKRTPTKRAKADDDTQQTADEVKETNDTTLQVSDGITAEETPIKTKRARQTKRTPVRKTPAKKTPAKRAKVDNDAQQTADEVKETNDTTLQESDGIAAEETPLKTKKARQTKRTPVRKTPAKKTPAKSAKVDNDAQQTADEVKETDDTTLQESDGIAARETPLKTKKARQTKRTPVRKTPAKKTPVTDGDLQTVEGGVTDAAQQENGTPKPKRKNVEKQHVQEVEPAPEPTPCEEEEEVQTGGRRRRGAAKAALKYLHSLAQEEFNSPSDDAASHPRRKNDSTPTEASTLAAQKTPKGRKGQKRKHQASDASDDEDFVPDAKEMEEEEEVDGEDEECEEEAEDSDSEMWMGRRRSTACHGNSIYPSINTTGRGTNGLPNNMMLPVWTCTETTKKFREEHHSSWVFPEWVPSVSHWHPVPESDLEKYLPQELQSAAFKVSREGLKQESPLQRLNRFTALPPHPDRWDMVLFTGGPVWTIEWCPTPDGAPVSQYIALACHREMDEKHHVNKIYSGHGLVQLWEIGKLDISSRPDFTPALSYGLAQDKGFIWKLKWCPAGGWEPPNCDKEAPLLPRLGLLAVATSTSVVTIYSLPHPEALLSNKKPTHSGKHNQQMPIYQAEGVLTLKLGSFKAPRQEQSGQVLSMDWLPVKPHNIMAIGFYDGVVGLWDLSSKTGLLRVRESDTSLSLLPYRCLLAHNHAVRALSFFPASRHLLVTAGDDRYLKTWDLRRLQDPITVLKRHLTNEVYWPLNSIGILWAQDNAYSASGLHGVHYADHFVRTLFPIPRTSSLWSISFSDWMNSVVTADGFGEVILSMLPRINDVPYVKRSKDRRFPVYLTSMVPYEKEGEQEMRGVEEEDKKGHAVEEQEEGETEGLNGSEGGNNNENGEGGGIARKDKTPSLCVHKYKETAKKYFLHHTDNNMMTFFKAEKRAVWKRMIDTEQKAKLNLDEVTLGALHKVCFNPNMLCHTWLASGGQSGLVRLNCLSGLTTPETRELINPSQAEYRDLCSAEDKNNAVQTVTEELQQDINVSTASECGL